METSRVEVLRSVPMVELRIEALPKVALRIEALPKVALRIEALATPARSAVEARGGQALKRNSTANLKSRRVTRHVRFNT